MSLAVSSPKLAAPTAPTAALAAAVNEFRKSIVALNGFTLLFDGEGDTPEMRRRAADCRMTAGKNARMVKRELDNISRSRMTPKVQEKVTKLKGQFQKLVKQYKKVTDAELARTKHAMEAAPQQQSMAGQQGSQQQTLAQKQDDGISFTAIEVDVDLTLLRERQKDYEQIQKDAQELYQLAGDVDGLVEEQGVELAVIEKNVSSAQARVTRGADNLGNARDYQRQYRKKQMCCICMMLCPCFFND